MLLVSLSSCSPDPAQGEQAPTPPMRSTVVVPANELLVWPSDNVPCVDWTNPPPVEKFAHGAFEIDHAPTSCTDYRACVAAGKCRALDDWCFGVVTVTLAQAQAYCTWQGAQVPSYAQWVAATYANGDRQMPAWRFGAPCLWGHYFPRCSRITERGFRYSAMDDLGDEWTRDRCRNPDGTTSATDVSLQSYGQTFTVTHPGNRSEFRCVGATSKATAKQ